MKVRVTDGPHTLTLDPKDYLYHELLNLFPRGATQLLTSYKGRKVVVDEPVWDALRFRSSVED